MSKRKASRWRDFPAALAYVQALNLRTHSKWREWARVPGNRPANIPSDPDRVYLDKGWRGYGHFLGTGTAARRGHQSQSWRSFEKARSFAVSLKLKSYAEWRAWRKTVARPADIPSDPNCIYSERGWRGYGHFLGTNNASWAYKWRSYDDARAFVAELRLQSHEQWRAYAKTAARPKDIPSNPNCVYLDKGWRGYGHWLGLIA